MPEDSKLKTGSSGLTRRSALLAGVGLAAAGAIQDAFRKTAGAQDTSAFYPPVTPGIDPRGARVQPYPAACVQSGVVPTFDSSGNFLPDGLKRNVDAMCELVRRGAGEHGARLMSFPEFGLQVPSAPMTPAQWWPGTIRVDGPEIERIGKAAQDANAYVAFNPMEGIDRFPGRYFLAGMIVGPSGDVILNYRKLTGLTGKTRPGDLLSAWLDHFGEDSLFPVADTPIGRLACVVAGDMNYPEIARGMVLKGAEVILSPTASATYPADHDFEVPVNTTMTRRVRAYENVAYVLLSDLGPVGIDPQPPYRRRQPSQIIDFKGNRLAGTQSGGVEYAVADIDIDALRRERTSLGGSNLLSHLQMPLHRDMYSATDFAPVNTHLDAPLVSMDEHRAAQRETVSRLVEEGILVPPGIG